MPQQTTNHSETYPAIIIGAGQAGVALSYCLQQRGVEHLVLEKDRPFADWYNRRWGSFAMNTPNWMNVLPGQQQPFAPQAGRNAFGTLKDTQEYFEAYLRAAQPPLRIEEVASVGVNRDGSWQVATSRGIYNTDNVAVCTGHASHKKIPPMARDVPTHVRQLHSSEYRNPAQIASANVLVVGSGSSGVQICHELAACDRFDTVYLAGSGNFTLPWTILGIPTYFSHASTWRIQDYPRVLARQDDVSQTAEERRSRDPALASTIGKKAWRSAGGPCLGCQPH